MGILNKLGIKWVYRKCPYGHIHNVNKDEGSCGHGGKIIDWCEEYHCWVSNPTKTEQALAMIEEDDEFAVERDAKARLEEALESGDIRPIQDFRKKIMGK